MCFCSLVDLGSTIVVAEAVPVGYVWSGVRAAPSGNVLEGTVTCTHKCAKEAIDPK